MKSRLDLARALYGTWNAKAEESSRPLTSTVIAHAVADSSGGTVRVDFGGDTVSGDGRQDVPVPTAVDVRSGDDVIVSLYGPDGQARTPVVTGVIGGGDRTQHEIEGKSEGSVPQYVQTSSATEAPAATAAWSETAPAWADGRYIWMRMAEAKDGKTTYTDPVCITGAKGEQGIKGDKGERGVPGSTGIAGKSSYVHIKYSAYAAPTDAQISDTPDAYIGVCTDSTEKDPETASSYTWSRFRGEDGAQGVPGAAGADGKTSYVHFAYSTTSDGKGSFSVTPFDGALYLGVVSDTAKDDPTDPSAYQWSLIKGAKGDAGTPGAAGADGKDGQMLVATSTTAAATAAKTATLASGTISLAAGTTVSVVFAEGNTAASPTLSLSGTDGKSTDAKPIMTNGTAYAYWQAGASVVFAYDGTCWQVCSAPVYGSTATIGNPAGSHVYIDSTGTYIYDGTKLLAKFLGSVLQIGPDSGMHASFDADSFDVIDSSAMQSLSIAKDAITFGAPSDTTMKVVFALAKIISLYTAGMSGSSTQLTLEAADTLNNMMSASVSLMPLADKDVGLGVTYNRLTGSDESLITAKADYLEWAGYSYWKGMVLASLPVVLYSNDSNKTVGAITLSNAASEFQRMTICFRTDQGYFGSAEVWDPDGAIVCLTANTPEPSGYMTAKGRCVKIDGTSINTYQNSGVCITAQAYIHSGTAPYYEKADTIFITRVIGYRKA